jgi:hypothetical protein
MSLRKLTLKRGHARLESCDGCAQLRDRWRGDTRPLLLHDRGSGSGSGSGSNTGRDCSRGIGTGRGERTPRHVGGLWHRALGRESCSQRGDVTQVYHGVCLPRRERGLVRCWLRRL